MKIHGLKIGVACVLVLLMSILMLSCSKDSDTGDPREGLITNETPHQVQINFESLKVVEVAPNTVVRENAVESRITYSVQITVLGDGGAILDARQLSVYIDKDANDQVAGSVTCSWYIRVFGTTAPFGYEAGS